MAEKRFQTDWLAVIIGVIMIIIGIIALMNPLTTWLTLAVLVGISAIVRGIVLIGNFIAERKCTGGNTAVCIFGIIFAAISIILGIYLLFNPGVALLTLGYIVAAWVIIDAINNLMIAWALRHVSNGFWILSLILNILLLIGGIYLFFRPLSGGLTASVVIAIMLVVSGIMTLINGFRKPTYIG